MPPKQFWLIEEWTPQAQDVGTKALRRLTLSGRFKPKGAASMGCMELSGTSKRFREIWENPKPNQIPWSGRSKPWLVRPGRLLASWSSSGAHVAEQWTAWALWPVCGYKPHTETLEGDTGVNLQTPPIPKPPKNWRKIPSQSQKNDSHCLKLPCCRGILAGICQLR